MAKHLYPIDLTRNEIQNAVLQVLASDPGTPVLGLMYFRSTLNRPLWYDGAAFIDLTARANHSGTQLAATISDFSAAADARITAAIGASVQAFDADLSALAALSATAGMLSRTGAGAFAVRTLASSTAAATWTNGDGAAGAPSLAIADVVAAGNSGLMTGADKTKLNGIATGATANSSDATLLARANHTGTQTASTISDFDTQVRTSRLDQMSAPTSNLSLNSQKIVSLADPTNPQDAATKKYVDDARAGVQTKDPVLVAVDTNVNLAAPGATLDGVTMTSGDRFLAWAQTTTTQNGLYVWNGAAAAATRSADADVAGEVLDGSLVAVGQGTYSGNQFIQRATPSGAPGAWAQDWAVYSTGGTSYSAGNGLTLATTTFNVGAGTGIVVNADDVAIDPAVVARKYTTLNAAGGTSWTINHALGNQWVHVQLFEVATLKQVEADITLTDANNATVTFASSQTANAFRAVVIG